VTFAAPPRPRLAAAGGLLAVLTAVLVTTGALASIDRYGVDHLMPWLKVRHHPFVTLASLTLPRLRAPFANASLELLTYPAAVVPSLLLLLVAASRLARADAIRSCLLWVAGNAVEVIGKLTLERPALYHDGLHVSAFDNSLPSGHTIRSLVLAGVVAAAWRRGRAAYVWAAVVPIALVLTGAHTPMDVIAGIFVAFALLGWVPPGRKRTRGVKSREPHQNGLLPDAHPQRTVS
jgi:membrane-associated phospholipid phosphatase